MLDQAAACTAKNASKAQAKEAGLANLRSTSNATGDSRRLQ